MKLKNTRFANGNLVTAYGTLKFDAEGFVIEPELSEENLKDLSSLKGFELVEAQKQSKEEVKAVKEESTKQEEKPAEEETEKPEAEEKPKRQKRTKKSEE